MTGDSIAAQRRHREDGEKLSFNRTLHMWIYQIQIMSTHPSRDFSPNLKQDLSGLSGLFRQLRSKSCFKMSGLSGF